MKTTLLIISLFAISISWGQEKQPKSQTVTIQTSAECDECKERLESTLNYTKGIVFAEVDISTKIATVKFKTKDISLVEIKQKIASIGYDADEIPADKTALEKLPLCCRPGGMHK